MTSRVMTGMAMHTSTDQSGYWDRSAASKAFAHPLDHDRFARAVPRDAPILDYGCGPGRLCHELSQLGFQHVHGVDSSPVMIQLAQSRHPDLNFSVVDSGTVPFPDASLGAVLLFAVLTCIPSPEGQRQLIAHIRRVLRPGGSLVISDYPLQHDPRNRDRYARDHAEFGHYGTFRLIDGAVVRHHPPGWFEELLAEFSLDACIERDAMTMNGNPARIQQWWATRPLPRLHPPVPPVR